MRKHRKHHECYWQEVVIALNVSWLKSTSKIMAVILKGDTGSTAGPEQDDPGPLILTLEGVRGSFPSPRF